MNQPATYHIWETEFGIYLVPAALYGAAKYRKDGLLDKRYSVRNRAMATWTDGIAQAESAGVNPTYTITPAGRAMLEGKS